jgi:hypothetical protein
MVRPSVKSRQILLSIVAAAALLLAYTVSCSDARDKEPSEMHFTVIDSLLGPSWEIPSAHASIRPPRDWPAVSDSLQIVPATGLSQSLAGADSISLVKMFIDSGDAEGMMIFHIRGVRLGSDTAAFLYRYYTSLVRKYGESAVQSDRFWIGHILVRRFLVAGEYTVRFELVCLQTDADAFALEYFAPQTRYDAMIRKMESSIGSLKTDVL